MFKWIKKIKAKNEQKLIKAIQAYEKEEKENKKIIYESGNNDEFYQTKGKLILDIILILQLILFFVILFIFLYQLFKFNSYLKYLIGLFLLIIAFLNLSSIFIDKTKYIDKIILEAKTLKITLLDKNRKTIAKAPTYTYDLAKISLKTKSIRSSESFFGDNYIFLIKENKKKTNFYIYPKKNTETNLWAFIIILQLKLQNKTFEEIDSKEFKKIYHNIFKGK